METIKSFLSDLLEFVLILPIAVYELYISPRIFKITLISVYTFFFIVLFGASQVQLANRDVVEYKVLKRSYKWLTLDLYVTISEMNKYHKIYKYVRDSKNYICALIQAESGGRNVVGDVNRNGTRDYCYMQVNEVHSKGNPRELLIMPQCIRKGCGYLSKALRRGRGDLLTATRLYNQGLGGKSSKYRRYAYVARVLNFYINHQRRSNYYTALASK